MASLLNNDKQKKKIADSQKPIKLLHESCFWSEEDPRWKVVNVVDQKKTSSIVNANAEYHDICLDIDSYIFVYSGRRGGGKTTSMTYDSIKAAVIYPKMRLISNYPIVCDVNFINGHARHIEAEPLDLYKLLCFDQEYQKCLILMDEAPDIISHMSSMTWKNRLLNIFVRQLRKNGNSLMLGAQSFNLIDKSMRWQVDVLIECEDASRKYGWPPDTRGECILQRWLDNSGMWTGQTWQDEQAYNRSRGSSEEVGETMELYPRFLWADEGHRAVFDTYYQQDVWESLRKVDMRLDSYRVGSNQGQKEEAMTPDDYEMAAALIEAAKQNGGVILSKEYYATLNITGAKKSKLGRDINSLPGFLHHHSGQNWFYDFTNVDPDSLRRKQGQTHEKN
jgi:hypothetical protein